MIQSERAKLRNRHSSYHGDIPGPGTVRDSLSFLFIGIKKYPTVKDMNCKPPKSSTFSPSCSCPGELGDCSESEAVTSLNWLHPSLEPFWNLLPEKRPCPLNVREPTCTGRPTARCHVRESQQSPCAGKFSFRVDTRGEWLLFCSDGLGRILSVLNFLRPEAHMDLSLRRKL